MHIVIPEVSILSKKDGKLELFYNCQRLKAQKFLLNGLVLL